jgi:hypothetical protein
VHVNNQSSNFELVSPEYLGHNIIWYTPPDQKVNANTRVSLRKNAIEDEFTSILTYKLQRKYLESSDQSDVDNTFRKDTSTNSRLLIIWGSNDKSIFYTRAFLVEYSDTITWDKKILEKLLYMYFTLFRYSQIVKDTWLLNDTNDTKGLMTISKWKKGSCTFEITISEGTRKDDSMAPLWLSSSM